MVLLAYRHGLRAAEVVDLRWEQVDFKGAILGVRPRRTMAADREPTLAAFYGAIEQKIRDSRAFLSPRAEAWQRFVPTRLTGFECGNVF
jgi:integrase